MPDVERLRSIKTFPSLVKYLRDELEWPIVGTGLKGSQFHQCSGDHAFDGLIGGDAVRKTL